MPFVVIHPRELEKLEKQKNVVIVDMRTTDLYRKGHYAGALNMPYREENAWFHQFFPEWTYVLYCAYGNDSVAAARRLAGYGITVYTVVGGMQGIQRYFSKKE